MIWRQFVRNIKTLVAISNIMKFHLNQNNLKTYLNSPFIFCHKKICPSKTNLVAEITNFWVSYILRITKKGQLTFAHVIDKNQKQFRLGGWRQWMHTNCQWQSPAARQTPQRFWIFHFYSGLLQPKLLSF